MPQNQTDKNFTPPTIVTLTLPTPSEGGIPLECATANHTKQDIQNRGCAAALMKVVVMGIFIGERQKECRSIEPSLL